MLMDVSDKELLSRYRHGDVGALESLVERYRRQLFAVIISMTQQQHEAEEVYQEVWLRVVRKQANYRHGNFCGWLVMIARNVFIDRMRRRKPDISLDAESEDGLSLKQVLPDGEPVPSEKIVAHDLGLLEIKLSCLPENHS
jgi:RNA polymerase sigma-70 factor (ECF subfamily)